MAIQNVESYYNKMAIDYENSMSGWGYCMAEAIADFLVKHGGLSKDACILDLGMDFLISGHETSQFLYFKQLPEIGQPLEVGHIRDICKYTIAYHFIDTINLANIMLFCTNQSLIL